jgi:hypothetical protein
MFACAGAVLLWFACPACFDAGASDNQEQVGRQERGRDPGKFEYETRWDADEGRYKWVYSLVYSDIILSPDGTTLLAMVPAPGPDKGYDEPSLVLVAQRLPNISKKVFPDLVNLERINFAPDGSKAFLVLDGGREIKVLDLAAFKISGSYQVDSPFSVADVTPDGRFLVLSNLPKTDTEEDFFSTTDCAPSWSDVPEGASRCEVGLVALDSGEDWIVSLPYPVRDIDFSTSHDEIMFTYSRWENQTSLATVEFYSPADRMTKGKVDFQNCADEMVIDRLGKRGLLSPTSCNKDPISILDLEKRTFVATLPGFGPVVVSQERELAVGFTRKADMKSAWNYQQTQDYGLIVVDLKTNEWKIVEYGDNAPSFTLSPEGGFLYVYEDGLKCVEQEDGTCKWENTPAGLAQYDVDTMVRKVISQGDPQLDRFVWDSTGNSLYVLAEGNLFRVGNGTAKVEEIPLTVEPELLNIRPQNDYLLLGEWDAPRFYLLDIPGAEEFIQVDLKL